MSSSLDKLVSNLPNNVFQYTSSEIKNDKMLNILKRKGFYPYDYMDSFDRFDEEKLPNKDDFFGILNGEHITDKNYKHAKNVWETFKINNIVNDLYLGTDVLLLADVFENFRKTCKQYYELDSCHCFTSLGLSWDAILKLSGIELELMSDMFQFIEKGMRGGVCYISHRHSEASNKCMKKYNKQLPSKYIMYLDANNLYRWAMSQYLPTGGFRWATEKEIDGINLATYKEDSKKGLMLEVDLEYPQELHNDHNYYPLAPEQRKVTKKMLSLYCESIREKFDISIGQVHN